MPDNIPVTIVAGELAPPACYSTERERYRAYIAATTAYIAGTNLEWVIQSGTPAAGDQGKAWLRVDINGYPIEALLWVTAAGTWVRWFTVPKYPTSSGGVANALTITFNPTILTRAVGDRFWFIAAATSTGATTLAIDSLAAAAIVKQLNVPLVANDIKAGQVVEVVWDGTSYQMLSALGSDGSGFPIANLAPGTERQIIRGIGNPTVVPTWQNQFLVTAQNSVPAAGAVLTVAHGLTIAGAGVAPGFVRWVLVCTDAAGDASYPQGREVDACQAFAAEGGPGADDTVVPAFTFDDDATNLNITRTATSAWVGPYLMNSSGSPVALTTSKWALKAYYA